MDRLSSCYFCGDAVDAALEAYPIVPSGAHPDVETDQRIVLCPSCRRKLTTVIEHVLEAALNGEEADDVPVLSEDDGLLDLEESNGEAMTATDVERIGGDADPGTDGSQDADSPTYSSSTPAGGRSTNSSATEDGSAEQSESDSSTSAVESTVDGGTDSSAGSDSDASTGSDTDSSSGDPSGGEYTRAEHNKVVRLLQNREFPVEIEEITVVARSAYGIDRDTTHEILESLIERGVIEDKGDRLVRP